MRIAWIGSAGEGGGVPGFGRDLLRGLAGRDVDLTVYTTEEVRPQIERLGVAGSSKCRFVAELSKWQWGRWYSKHAVSIFIAGLLAKAEAHRRVVKRLVADHADMPFDVVVQFTQFELLSLRRHLKQLPPVAVFPCVHAAGELRWHRAESRIARQSERAWVHRLVRANLLQRSVSQRRDAKRVALQFGMSRRFNDLVRQDYGVPADRQAVVYQPAVDLTRGPGPTHRRRAADEPVRLLFVGRIAVRKGVEQLVALSRALADSGGDVVLEVVGAPSFWSNYTGELRKLDPHVATYAGPLKHDDILERMAASDVLVMPSRYEPGGIVVAEAMSQGCLPVVSDEVGSAEPVSDAYCERFVAGDTAAFEAACRRGIDRVRCDGVSLRERVAAEARRAFEPGRQIDALLTGLERIRRAGEGDAVE